MDKEKYSEDKKKKLILISSVATLVASSLVLLFFLFIYEKEEAPQEVEKPKVWDVTKIPTELELDELMQPGVVKFYGEDESRGLNEEEELRTIFDTKISFVERFSLDATDRMVYTAMAFQRNPYAIKESHKLNGGVGDTVRELPDETSIDLAEVVQVYDDISLYGSRENPALFTVEGWCNGEWFTEDVDLMQWYEMNNYFQ